MTGVINPTKFVSVLSHAGLKLWAGVPDSLLKDLCAAASDELGRRFLITANEGNAIGVACGWHVATGEAAVVFMQNSGEGNAVNPLLSLADPDVYSIPMLLIIGWRGEPGIPDEPQHAKQGKVTLSLLEAMGVPYEVLDTWGWENQLKAVLGEMRLNSRPAAIVIRRGTFAPHPFKPSATDDPLSREEALGLIIDGIGMDDLVVATTGKCGRELFEIRDRRNQSHDRDFLCVGGMGHTLSIAYGLALGCPKRVVWCLDGDGSMIMHMGSVAVSAQEWPSNLRYIVNVNGAHESVGGQPNVGRYVDVPKLLFACGLTDTIVASNSEEISKGVIALAEGTARAMVLYTRQGSRADLGRPTIPPADNKNALMASLSQGLVLNY